MTARPGPGGGRRGATYPTEAAGRVRFLPVELGGEVIGYLWTAVSNGAASYIRRLSMQDIDSGFDGAAVWTERMREAYAEGLAAEEAFRRWKGAPEHPEAGAVPAGAEFNELGSYDELQQLANPGHVEPESPDISRYLPDGTPFDRSTDWGPLGPFKVNGPGYKMATDSALRYLPAFRGGQLLGYLWAAETDDAAGFVPRVKARVDGHRAKSRWIARMKQCEGDGLSPLEMLRGWTGAPEDPKAGRIPAGTDEQSAPSLQELKVRARD